MNELLAAALRYAEQGWRVFPLHGIDGGGNCTCRTPDCPEAGKHPYVDGGLYAATNNIDRITAWWTKWPKANIGVTTGMSSGIVVLDVDAKTGGHETLREHLISNGPLPITAACATGGGGLHLYFEHPGRKVSNKQSLGPGLDVRGDGGYVVVPPSLHASGRWYEWIDPTEAMA